MVVITDKSIGVSQLLGARVRAAPPKSTPMTVCLDDLQWMELNES